MKSTVGIRRVQKHNGVLTGYGNLGKKYLCKKSRDSIIVLPPELMLVLKLLG
jgi:hypothetical protein